MTDDINYKNNPLHGVSLKTLLEELVNHYGFEILYAYLNLNCFKSNASVESSVKFLKKTDWAREKVEAFYLYQYKSLPRASAEQFELPPRDRIIPEGDVPGEPAELSVEDGERLQAKRAMKAAKHGSSSPGRNGAGSPYGNSPRAGNTATRSKKTGGSDTTNSTSNDPWAKWKK